MERKSRLKALAREDYSRERRRRMRRLASWIKENEFDSAIFIKEEIESFNGNYLYYGGDHLSGEYGAIIVDSTGECSAIAHEYSFERVRNSCEYSHVYEVRQSISEVLRVLRNILDSRDSRRNAFDLSGSAAAFFEFTKKGKQVSQVKNSSPSLREFVFRERSVKSQYEISQMESAIRTAKLGLESTIGSLKAGQRISEISTALNGAMVQDGALGTSFETDIRIRRDLKEAEVDRLQSGDLLLFDFGARLPSMYLSDVGRTIPFGEGRKEIELLENVCSIKKAGLKKISKGRSGNKVREDIDDVIREHGYVSTHRPGHQIGLNVHEPYGPHLNYGKENSAELEEGNVVTWEPGIGIMPNRPKNSFGMAHMEDMVLVRAGGAAKALGNLDLKYW